VTRLAHCIHSSESGVRSGLSPADRALASLSTVSLKKCRQRFSRCGLPPGRKGRPSWHGLGVFETPRPARSAGTRCCAERHWCALRGGKDSNFDPWRFSRFSRFGQILTIPIDFVNLSSLRRSPPEQVGSRGIERAMATESGFLPALMRAKTYGGQGVTQSAWRGQGQSADVALPTSLEAARGITNMRGRCPPATG
jgi:hypothetical protein